MKPYILIFAIVSTFAFAACGKKGGPTAATPGYGPSGTNVDIRSCQVGQVYSPTHGCLNRNSCQEGYGWIPGESYCIAGTVVTEEIKFGTSYGARFFGGMHIHNTHQFDLLLKYAGLCDPYWVGWNFGYYKCSYWSSKGGFVDVSFFNGGFSGGTTSLNSANLFIGAGTSNPYMFNPNNYSFSLYGLTSSTPYIGFSNQAKVVDYNNSSGMQVIAIGMSGHDIGLRAVVETGRPSSSSLVMKLFYQSVHFATVNAERY
jgi:hypothetical protein